MLQSLSMPLLQIDEPPRPLHAKHVYERNEKEDMKKAIELLYEFKNSLSELHPNCLNLIENMLQHRRF